MSRLCGNHLKWCCGWATGPQKCEHVETDNVEECPNYEVPTEILRHREENRKLREAVKVERAMRHQYFLEEDIDMMVDAWNHCGNKIREECLKLAESELRAEGVIE